MGYTNGESGARARLSLSVQNRTEEIAGGALRMTEIAFKYNVSHEPREHGLHMSPVGFGFMFMKILKLWVLPV